MFRLGMARRVVVEGLLCSIVCALPGTLVTADTGGQAASGTQAAELKPLLEHAILEDKQVMTDLQRYAETRLLPLPNPESVQAWEQYADKLRADFFEKVIYRGEAARWREAPTRVEWLDTIPGGAGYHIRKLRFEAVPGLWVPALLYEPEQLTGKVPVALAVNGHDGKGKAVPYKQVRCINQAKRGMVVLNVEWFGMGQLATPDFLHYRMNQLDLCGTSGLAVFYESMRRSLDILLAHEHADPERVAVSGLSGGGWQTIFISSLDKRVKLANPVAGYSGLATRVQNHFKDLGDSEQAPVDMNLVADYTHLTALLAPRPTLLTYNSKDECCFRADYALEPLMAAAKPFFALYGKPDNLRSHVNDDPGTHNFEKDNRQAYYHMLADFFYAGSGGFDPTEIPSDDEVKTPEQLFVELPADNADFRKLGVALARDLPRDAALPTDKAATGAWQEAARTRLREIVRATDFAVEAKPVGGENRGDVQATFWRLGMNGIWTVPAVELVRGEPKSTAILVADDGRASAAEHVERLLAAGNRVVAIDPFYFGESKIAERDFLFALVVSSLGDRPLGLQAGQLAAAARWLAKDRQTGPVTLVANGPRSSLFAVVAGGLEPQAIGRVELRGTMGGLKEIIELNESVEKKPELFCFGLLEAFDVKRLVALVAPRPVVVAEPSDRAKAELVGLKEWYALVGAEFDPLGAPQ